MRLYNYITEAPIRIDLFSLNNRLDKVFAKHPRSKVGLIDDLNKEFKSDDIEFMVSEEEPDITNSYTFPDDNSIVVTIGIDLLLLPSKELIKRILEDLEHELIHKQQLIKSDGKSLGKSIPEINADTIDSYLANKEEIMSYAAQIVTTLRHEGYHDNQIIDMLRNPQKWLTKIVKSRSHLEMYMEVFKKDSYQIKRLKKYIIQYIGV